MVGLWCISVPPTKVLIRGFLNSPGTNSWKASLKSCTVTGRLAKVRRLTTLKLYFSDNLDHFTEFPARSFLRYILDIVIHLTGSRTGANFSTKYIVMRADLAASLDNLKGTIQSHQTSLSHALNKRLRRSPKRRGLSEETEESIRWVFCFDLHQDVEC